jgi:O-antigen/teichoic acid export membrane protein
MKLLANRAGFARIFGGAVISQALLSVINLLTALILIRRVPQAQYGYYVLIAAGAPLLAQLQNQLVQPLLTSRINIAGAGDRKSYVGGLVREQRWLVAIFAAVGLFACGLLWVSGLVQPHTAAIITMGVIAALATLFREFFRMILVTFRRPYDVLRADIVFAVLLIGGVWLSTLTDVPAVISALTLTGSGVVGGWLLMRALWRHDPWHKPGLAGAFATSVRVGLWTAIGAVIHWMFSQGYSYIVAAHLDVHAVAAIAATRLLLSPLGVMSLGIGSIMFSTATLWLQHHGMRGLLRRLLLFTLGMSCAALVYFAVMWLARDWIFANVLKSEFEQRDLLLGIWSAIFFCTVIRDQLVYFQLARGHFKRLAGLTLCCAVLGLTVTFIAIPHFGAAGGLCGLLAGEFINVVGLLTMAALDLRRNAAEPAGAGS